MKNQKNIIIGLSLLVIFFSSLFLTPNYDDGQGAYWIYNTIDLENSFYSDYFKARFVVEKIPTLIMGLGFTYFFPFSFTFPAALYGLLSLLCSFIAYKISKFYTGSKTSLLCSQIFLYAILTHNWICPTRSELWLLIVILMVIYFIERYQKKRENNYLILISFIVGILGLPIHPNASILYVYFIGYLIVNKDIISGRDLMRIIMSLVISSFIGIAIVLYPDPIESINFLKTMSTESGNRFIPNIINPKRFMFIISLPYYKYIVGLFILLLIGWISGNWKELDFKVKRIFKSYKNIFLYFGAAIIGIEILPAAKWTVYFIYYFFPLSFIASKLLFNKISKRYRYCILFLTVLLLIRFIVVNGYQTEFIETINIIKLLIFYIPIISLITFFNKGRLILIYGVLYLGLSLNIFYNYKNWIVYNDVKEVYLNNADKPIISIAQFNWIDRSNSDYAFAPFLRNLKPDDLKSGLYISGNTESAQAWPLVSFLTNCSNCDMQLIGEIKSSFNQYVFSQFSNLRIYKYSGFDVIKSPFN